MTNYILDASVLLFDPKAVLRFGDNRVYLPIDVIEYLDKCKNDLSEDNGLRAIATEASATIRSLNKIKNRDSSPIYQTPDGGEVRIAFWKRQQLEDKTIGHAMLSIAVEMQKKEPKSTVVVVTREINIQIKAEVLGLIAEIYESTSSSTKAVGKEKTLKAFISYSMIDKVWAAKTKNALAHLEMESFMAHDDLVVSEEWKSRIVEELLSADILVCLLSKDFKASDWCPQELGFIVARPETIIIPLSLDGTVPFGFINHIQSQALKLPSEMEIEGMIINALLRRKLKLGVHFSIQQMLKVKGYRIAEDITRRLVQFFPTFSPDQANAFAEAAVKNATVWDAGECATEILPKFLDICGNIIAEKTAKSLRFQITERVRYEK